MKFDDDFIGPKRDCCSVHMGYVSCSEKKKKKERKNKDMIILCRNLRYDGNSNLYSKRADTRLNYQIRIQQTYFALLKVLSLHTATSKMETNKGVK